MFYFLNLYSYRENSRKKTNVFNSFNSLNSFNSSQLAKVEVSLFEQSLQNYVFNCNLNKF